jgi:hypothetical protein
MGGEKLRTRHNVAPCVYVRSVLLQWRHSGVKVVLG